MPRGLSERAHQKVLETAAELFADRGIDTTSMDAIAAKSGVSKATIYKHWSDKDALCMEVMTFLQGLDEGPPKLDRLEGRHGRFPDLRSPAAHRRHQAALDAASDRLLGAQRRIRPRMARARHGTPSCRPQRSDPPWHRPSNLLATDRRRTRSRLAPRPHGVSPHLSRLDR